MKKIEHHMCLSSDKRARMMRKRLQKNRAEQDSNLRGGTPIAFETIALTTRPSALGSSGERRDAI